MRYAFLPIALVAALSLSGPAQAASVVFSGTRTNVDTPGTPAARCGSRFTASIRNDPPAGATASGTSNVGNFTPTMSHCITLPLSVNMTNVFDLGEFIFQFDTGTIFGTYEGVIDAVTPGVFTGSFNIAQSHIVTGGTGFFAGTTGSFKSAGVLTIVPGQRPNVTQRFEGVLDIPAVPEPATWGMMILGFGVIGSALRSRRRVAVRFAPA